MIVPEQLHYRPSKVCSYIYVALKAQLLRLSIGRRIKICILWQQVWSTMHGLPMLVFLPPGFYYYYVDVLPFIMVINSWPETVTCLIKVFMPLTGIVRDIAATLHVVPNRQPDRSIWSAGSTSYRSSWKNSKHKIMSNRTYYSPRPKRLREALDTSTSVFNCWCTDLALQVTRQLALNTVPADFLWVKVRG